MKDEAESASVDPGIVTTPRSVVQVPMTGNVPKVSGRRGASVSVLPGGSRGSSDEEDKEEDEESGHVDDEEDVDQVKEKCTTIYCVEGLEVYRQA
jgi:hypothetical protein